MMLGVAFFFACDLWGMREGQFVVYMGPSDEVHESKHCYSQSINI